MAEHKIVLKNFSVASGKLIVMFTIDGGNVKSMEIEKSKSQNKQDVIDFINSKASTMLVQEDKIPKEESKKQTFADMSKFIGHEISDQKIVDQILNEQI